MLHNILINANKYTEIAKQGEHINIVLASGDIVVRIRYKSGQVEQTSLVAGMSFRTREPFVSVSFTSDVSQQTKIWLSDMPLTYSPIESKVVGSSSMQSYKKDVFYGEISEILPARVGRNNITMQANKDFFISGVGGTLNNAIKVPANTVFRLATQSAVYGHSGDPDDKPIAYSVLKEPVTLEDAPKTLSRNEMGFYNEVTDEYLYHDYQWLYRVPASDLTTRTLINTISSYELVPWGLIERDNDFRVFGEKLGKLYILTVDKTNYALTDETIVHDPIPSGVRLLDVIGDFVLVQYDTDEVYKLALDGSYQTQISRATIPANLVGNSTFFIYLTSDEVFAYNAPNAAWAVTSDNGATWVEGIFPADISISYPKASGVDRVTGRLFIARSNGMPYYSDDNGRTWKILDLGVDSPSSGVTAMNMFDGVIYLATGQEMAFHNGIEWLKVDLPYVSTPTEVRSCNNGAVVITTQDGHLYITQGEIVYGGGNSIGILEENN